MPTLNPVSSVELAAAVKKLGHARVLVVGDAMLDRYIFGRITRISPEAPVPVMVVEKELAQPGGAGNVVHNLIGLGAACAFVSVIGDDRAGTELTGLIGGQSGVEPWLLVQGGRQTTVKTRFVAESARRGGQHLLRADREDTRPIHPKLAERLLRVANGDIAATSVVVLSDYRKGVLAGDIPAQLIATAQAAGRRVVIDLRSEDWARFAGADVLVPHAHNLLGEDIAGTDAQIAEAGQALRRAHGFGALLIKRGAEGLSFVDADGCMHMRLATDETRDLAGAGDAAVAALAACLAAGITPRVAAAVARAACGLVGSGIGSGIVRAKELLAMVSAKIPG